MALNVLFKSTTHISIGDDIAFFGTKSLFDRVLPGHNAFLYSSGEKDTWKPDTGIDIDLVVIAGTPIWSGREMSGLEDFIIQNRKPVFYCGVGMNYGENANTSRALEHAIGFIARDNHAYKRAIQDTDARSFSCPSIFSTEPHSMTDTKIGIIPQIDTWPEEQEAFIRKHDPKDTLIICNEIVEYIWAEKNIPEYEAVYSRWLPDMIGYYRRCKAIYSMRIHGAHLAYALGIPTVCLKSAKDKSVVCEKIGLKLVPPAEVTEADLRNDQSMKADLRHKFMDYIVLQMREHFPDHVTTDWKVGESPATGQPVEWSDDKYRKELKIAAEKGEKRRAGWKEAETQA